MEDNPKWKTTLEDNLQKKIIYMRKDNFWWKTILDGRRLRLKLTLEDNIQKRHVSTLLSAINCNAAIFVSKIN